MGRCRVPQLLWVTWQSGNLSRLVSHHCTDSGDLRESVGLPPGTALKGKDGDSGRSTATPGPPWLLSFMYSQQWEADNVQSFMHSNAETQTYTGTVSGTKATMTSSNGTGLEDDQSHLS